MSLNRDLMACTVSSEELSHCSTMSIHPALHQPGVIQIIIHTCVHACTYVCTYMDVHVCSNELCQFIEC